MLLVLMTVKVTLCPMKTLMTTPHTHLNTVTAKANRTTSHLARCNVGTMGVVAGAGAGGAGEGTISSAQTAPDTVTRAEGAAGAVVREAVAVSVAIEAAVVAIEVAAGLAGTEADVVVVAGSSGPAQRAAGGAKVVGAGLEEAAVVAAEVAAEVVVTEVAAGSVGTEVVVGVEVVAGMAAVVGAGGLVGAVVTEADVGSGAGVAAAEEAVGTRLDACCVGRAVLVGC